MFLQTAGTPSVPASRRRIIAGRSSYGHRLEVTGLCDAAVVGAQADEHEAKARAGGLQVMSWQDPKPGRPAVISASAGLFFFRWVCVVEHTGGKVTATRAFLRD